MPDEFDPYYKWLAIPPEEQPPHHYRLLGVRAFESDSDVIATAADQRMSHLRTYQSGKHSALSQRLLNEIAAARLSLLNPAKRAAYDEQLRAELGTHSAPPAAPPPHAAAPPWQPAAPPLVGLPGHGAHPAAHPMAQPLRPPVAGGPMTPLPLAAPLPLTIGGTTQANESPSSTMTADPSVVLPSATSARRTQRKKNAWISSWVPALLVVVLVAAVGWAAYHYGNQPAPAHPSHPQKKNPVSRKEASPSDAPPATAADDRPGEATGSPPKDTAPPKESPPAKTPTPPAKSPESEWVIQPVPDLLKRVKAHIDQSTVEQSEPAGGTGGSPFEEIPQAGALLVGLKVSIGEFGGHRVVRAVQAVYLTARGLMPGAAHGDLGGETVTLQARPGYAAGAMSIRAGQRVDGLRLVFMRIRAAGLDPRDAYASDWAGGEGGDAPTTLGGQGQAVVGLFGSFGAELDQLGLVLDVEPVAPSNEPAGEKPSSPDTLGSLPQGSLLPKKERLPIPSAESQKDATALIHTLFKNEFAEAKTTAQRFALAVKLFHKAEETNDDPTARYVMICEARDLAARCGDSQAVADTIILLAHNYEIDDLAMTLASFEKAAEVTSAPASLKRRLVENCLTLVDKGAARHTFEAAEQFVHIGRRAAGKAQDSILAQRVVWRHNRLKEQRAAFDEIAPAFDKLAANPQDAAANLAVGRYRCFFDEDWAEGLPLLARASDPALADIARQELADPDDPEAMLKLADAWDARAVDDQVFRSHCERRAKFWYERAVTGLAGIKKARVEKKLDELLGGRGLKGEYFRGTSLAAKDRALTRIDPNLDFPWYKRAPADELAAENYSVRWTGQLVGPAKADYQLTIVHDDGVRLWMDGKLVIDDWNTAGTSRAMVSLSNKPRQLKLEFWQGDNDGKLIVKWAQKGGFGEQVVPPEAFYQDKAGGAKSFSPLPYPAYKPVIALTVPKAQRAAGENLDP